MTSRIIEGCALSATIGNRKYRVRVTAERTGREWEGWEDQVFYVDVEYQARNGHTFVSVSEDTNDRWPISRGRDEFDLPLGWMPTEGQLEKIGLDAVEKALQGKLQPKGMYL